jgi:hypothetical protein
VLCYLDALTPVWYGGGMSVIDDLRDGLSDRHRKLMLDINDVLRKGEIDGDQEHNAGSEGTVDELQSREGQAAKSVHS